MNPKYITARYTFAMGDVNFTVEIDDTLSAEYVRNKYIDEDRKRLHYHPLHELFLVFDDGIEITLEDGKKEYKNCILSLPPNKKHTTNRISDYRFLFSCSPRGNTGDGFSEFFLNMFSSEDVYCIPKIEGALVTLLRELLFHFSNPQTNVINDVIVSLLKVILFNIYVSAETPFVLKEKYSDESRYIILSRLISECILPSNDVTLSTVAEALHLSEKQASKIIYRYYGKSLTEVITEEKLEYASYLLSSTDVPISEIAYRCNFHSENYFYCVFKRKFGVTPLKYRKGKSSEKR